MKLSLFPWVDLSLEPVSHDAGKVITLLAIRFGKKCDVGDLIKVQLHKSLAVTYCVAVDRFFPLVD